MTPLSPLERAAWQRLAEAEVAVDEARDDLIRITNREHARRTRRLRLVSPTPEPRAGEASRSLAASG